MTISRATLPQEFYDVVSARMLTAPEPQYLHGMLAKMALGASLSDGQMMGISAGRDIPNVGAGLLSLEQERLALADPIMSEAILSVADLARGTIGHTVRLNRMAYANTTYTEASRQVTAGQSISTTPVDVTAEQVSITLKRFAGPYDSTNSRVAPHSVDQLDAQRSVHSLAAIVGKHLKRDFDRWLDKVCVTLFDAGASTVYPSGFSADNDITAAGVAGLTLDQLFAAERTLAEANAPQFPGGFYAFAAHPRQLEALKNESAFQRLAVFEPNVNPLLKQAYVATVGSIRIFVSNTLNSAANSSSVTVYKGQMFGPGMVGMGVGQAPRVLSSTDDNYGLQAKVIWEFCAGFALLDNRFGVSVRNG